MRVLPHRFWSKVKLSGACWEWQACVNQAGYGIFGIEKTKVDRAHRIAYRIFYGDIPDGLFICHSCDNRKCVRPDHLFAGSNQDNVNDMVRKNRNSPPPNRGGWNKYKLTDSDKLRLGKESDIQIANALGVDKNVIRRARAAYGIEPFKSDTRFKKGDPHPRWSREKKGG